MFKGNPLLHVNILVSLQVNTLLKMHFKTLVNICQTCLKDDHFIQYSINQEVDNYVIFKTLFKMTRYKNCSFVKCYLFKFFYKSCLISQYLIQMKTQHTTSLIRLIFIICRKYNFTKPAFINCG
jgi:hypothetical protein